MSSQSSMIAWRLGPVGPLALIGAGATVALSASLAFAYRPFDGTDAAVADLNQVEIEFQPFGLQQDASQKTLIAPGMRFNWGFAEQWELVVEGQLETPLSPGGVSSLAANGAFLKYVVKPGVLQEQTGVSIATEFGPLLPDVNGERGTGFSWAGIVSQRWDWGTVHLNVETNLTRDQRGEAFLGTILEGPAKWTIRPVVEVFYDKIWTQTESYSGLVGAIWQVRDNLSFDAAYRYGLVNRQPVSEIRAGLTFAFAVDGEKAETKPGVTFAKWGPSRL
jgi:opacity protein-like surface antigen